jgi:hypothetical protein
MKCTFERVWKKKSFKKWDYLVVIRRMLERE